MGWGMEGGGGAGGLGLDRLEFHEPRESVQSRVAAHMLAPLLTSARETGSAGGRSSGRRRRRAGRQEAGGRSRRQEQEAAAGGRGRGQEAGGRASVGRLATAV